MEPQPCRKLDGHPSSDQYRHALRAIGEELQAPVIRRHDMMRDWLAEQVPTPAEMLSPDRLHMADGGYAKLAEAIAQDIFDRAESRPVAMDLPRANRQP